MTEPQKNRDLCLFTIGHSNHGLETFLKLLSDNAIEVLIDVRSHAHSKFAKHFDATHIQKAVIAKRMKYLYLGKELGGWPETPECYDKEGHVLYNLVAESPSFLQGIRRLLSGIARFRIVAMCSEEDPTDCHRRLLIGRMLTQHGVRILHIRADGRVQTEEELTQEKPQERLDGVQLSMLDQTKEELWRSTKPTRSASRSGGQKNSSKR